MNEPKPLSRVEIKNGQIHYGIYDLGAHVYAYQPRHQKPVLWVSQHAKYEVGQAIRGGIPIILPWFGSGPSGSRKPAHGFARLHEWTKTGVEYTIDSDGRMVVHYELSSKGETCPVSWIADYRVDFGPERLVATLTIINTGNEPFIFEDALHTYLAVGDIKNISISGLEDTAYIDKSATATVSNCLQNGPITFTGETDRVYLSSGRVVVTDPVWNRRVIVEKSGSSNTVIWNPWVEKAAEMSDFGADEWRGMVCVEAGNVIDNAVALTPGAAHVLTQKISVEML